MLRIAVDVGGTFTDVVAYDEGSGKLVTLKVDSTPLDPSKGFMEGLKSVLQSVGRDVASVGLIVHATTIATNAFRGQVGLRRPKVALVTTEGMRDVIEIARQNRPRLYDLFFERPRPLVERPHRYEVRERVSARGEVLKRPTEEELSELGEKMRREGFDSVAICFINSYLNNSNEELVKNFLEKALNVLVFASYAIDPQHREYERTSTTVVNAYLAPIVSSYMRCIRDGLEHVCIRAPLLVMSSAGGVVDVAEAIERPVLTIESGPAAGVVGAAELAKQLGIRDVLTLDVGGTTAKASVIRNFEPSIVNEHEVGGEVHVGRYLKGSGYVVRYPSVDVAEVSAGGGSLVWADPAGSIRVGPMSAGADPGPACYGKGGEHATITDANLVLGRLGEYLLGGQRRLRKDLALRSMESVAEACGMDVVEVAALAIHVANLLTFRAMRVVSLDRGIDPRGLTLMAFGGAGPMHTAELAELMGIERVVIPYMAEVFSSLGLLLTDMKYAYSSPLMALADSIDPMDVERRFSAMEIRAMEELRPRLGQIESAVINRTLDVRYLGEGYELEVPIASPVTEESLRTSLRNFEALHEQVYGFSHRGEQMEVTALRIYVVVQVRKPRLRFEPTATDALVSQRDVYFDGNLVPTPVYRWEGLKIGSSEQGPAIIESYGSTVVVPPDWTFTVNDLGAIVLERC